MQDTPTDPPPPRGLDLFADVAAAVGLLILGLTAFGELRPLSFVGSDSVDPLWRAYKILTGRDALPPLHSPVAGYALYYNLLPTLWGAGSLSEVVSRVWTIAALIPPILYLGCRVGVASLLGPSRGRATSRLVGLVAGAWLALSPDLADTPLSGARTYFAPLWSAVATAATLAALGGARRALLWLGLALPLGAMSHPFALALAPGGLALAALRWRPWHRALAGAAALGALLSAPHVYHLIRVALDQGLGHATDGSSLEEGFWPQLLRSFHDAFLVHSDAAIAVHALFFAGPVILLAGGALARRRGRAKGDAALSEAGERAAAFGAFTALSLLSLIGLAIAIQYLQHYHLRILWPPLAVAGAWGAALTLEGLVLTVGARPRPAVWTAVTLGIALPLGAAYAQPHAFDWLQQDRSHRLETVMTHAQLSSTIAAHARGAPRIIDAVHVRAGATLYPPAIVLDQLLRGEAEGAFPTRPDALEGAQVYLLIVAPDALLDAAAALAPAADVLSRTGGQQMQGDERGGVMVVALRDAAASRAFSAGLCALLPEGEAPRLGTVYNYMAPLDADFGAGWVGLWFDPCLMERVP